MRFTPRHLLAAALTAAALALPVAAPAAASPTHNKADAAAGWLARQMADSQRFEVVFDGVTYPDQGLTIDAIFAFAASKTGSGHAGNAIDWLAQPAVLTGYLGDGATEAYVGGTAKLALAAQVTGVDATAFGGIDLISRLRGLQAPSGRFADLSAWGDYTNAFTQSFAILALDRTTTGAPAAAVSYLAGSRCADGGYPLLFEQATCASDVEATAMATQALIAAGDLPAAWPGLTWLVGQQQPGGGFASYGVVNANSTGLAAAALHTGGRLLAAANARGYLRTLHQGCTAPVADRGAIAFTTGVFDPSTAPRATAQAVLGLTATGYAQLTLSGAGAATPTLACP
jgi:hypothetical protein